MSEIRSPPPLPPVSLSCARACVHRISSARGKGVAARAWRRGGATHDLGEQAHAQRRVHHDGRASQLVEPGGRGCGCARQQDRECGAEAVACRRVGGLDAGGRTADDARLHLGAKRHAHLEMR
eukprot:5042496-Prymnesium_polylepis.3